MIGGTRNTAEKARKLAGGGQERRRGSWRQVENHTEGNIECKIFQKERDMSKGWGSPFLFLKV